MQIARTSLTALALVALAAATAFAAAKPATTTVTMKAENGSGESGTAVLTQEKGGVQVVVTLKGAPKTAQPSHIHDGTCAKLGGVSHPLSNVVKGSATTLVKGATIAELLKGGYAINVHKSASDLATNVACGDIAEPAKSM